MRIASLLLALALPGAASAGGGGGSDRGGGGSDRGGGDKGGRNDGDKGGDKPGAGDKGERKPDDRPILDSPLERLEAPCAEGDAASCLEAARMWLAGWEGQKPNAARAENLFRAGCVFGSAAACFEGASMYLTLTAGLRLEMPDGVPSGDGAAARDLLRQGCDRGLLIACAREGELLLDPSSGFPVGARVRDLEQDFFGAVQAFERGCAEGSVRDENVRPDGKVDAHSCVRLGEMHEHGIGASLNASLSARYYDRACRAGEATACAPADRMREAAAKGRDDTRADQRDGVGSPSSGDGSLSNPDAERFRELSAGTRDGRRGPGIRIDLTPAVGFRVRYAPGEPFAGIKFRLGTALWVNLIGFRFETAFTTDSLFNRSGRDYTRYLHSLSLEGMFPIPARLPIPAILFVGIGGGPALGSLSLEGQPFVTTWGARQYLQFGVLSPQERGARTYGAIRVEQQQAGWRGGNGVVEHSTQAVVVFGFMAGGVGPYYPGKLSENTVRDPGLGR